jgi:hypothetical protein
MRGAIVAALVAVTVGGAFVAHVAAYAAGTDGDGDAASAPERPAAGRAAVPAVAETTPAAPRAVQASAATRVSPGVLARAVSRRAQERAAATPAGQERRRGHVPGEVISVEIDWHAGSATP